MVSRLEKQQAATPRQRTLTPHPLTGPDRHSQACLGALVRRRRWDVGMTQRQLADVTDVNLASLPGLEQTTTSRPRLGVLARPAQGLDPTTPSVETVQGLAHLGQAGRDGDGGDLRLQTLEP